MIHLTISGWSKVDGYLATGRYDGLVSIASPPGENRGKLRAKDNLLLDFDDTWPGHKSHWIPPSKEQVQSILDFGYRIREAQTNPMVVCHCGRGRSRSTAAAILLMFTATVWTPEVCCRHLFAHAPKSTPNAWMLKLGEEITGAKFIEHCFGRAKGNV